jgi:tRNA-2-methylthio-N6-dimethylallyladenosine synthase
MTTQGDVKKYHVITYGCQMNKSDSERIASIFEQYACSPTTNPQEADFIVMNTCSIRQSAENRVYSQAHQFNKWKKDKPELQVVITGCMAPRVDAVQKASGVDHVLNIKDLAELPSRLGLVRPEDNARGQDYFSIAPKFTTPFQVYIPIMTGCNNFCTFCVVPFTRGREFSRPMLDVIKEVENAIAQGAKEITLLGQNVNSYAYGFEELLRRINELSGEFWVRFVSSNPQDMSDELIDVVAGGEKLCNYMHFAVQAGNDRILKKMNRRHTIEEYNRLIDRMRSAMPDMGMSTDIIVGFPGETEEEFEDTVKLCERTQYDMAYISQYSIRTGTPAWRLTDDVPREEKKRRDVVLTEILKKTARANAEKLVGTQRKVLIERINKRGWLSGKEEGFRTVTLPEVSDEDLIGTFIEVEIIAAHSFGVDGSLVGSK